ncbi:MAG: hypothetical protein H7Y02_00260 [Candidatus Obscuribacterales bacterium]|nr:hypothetical protein [Steroidobacteraceae bacterium]
MIDGFLLGVIVTVSLTASAFFLKFWRQTRDQLFLAFAASFCIEGINRVGFLFLERPNEGDPLLYIVRLCAYSIIVVAIINKNRAR